MSFTLRNWLALIISSLLAYAVFGNISSKAGDPRWHGLVMAIPLLNLVALVVFAHSEWPIEAKLLESQLREPKNQTALR